MLLQTVYSLTILATEMPTGVMADVIGRRISLLLSSILQSIASLVYFLGRNLFHFLLGEVLWGIGASFMSGTLAALLYDSLLQTGKEGEYKAIFGRGQMFGLIASALAFLIGGFLSKINLRYPLGLTSIIFSISILSALFFQEPKRSKRYRASSLIIIKESLNLIFKSRVIQWLTLYLITIGCYLAICQWFYQPYLLSRKISLSYFGAIYTGFTLLTALNAKFAHRYEKYIKEPLYLLSIFTAFLLSLFLMPYLEGIFSIILILLQQSLRGAYSPIVSYYINKYTPSEFRATLLSFENLAGRALFALTSPIMGLLADIHGLNITFMIMGLSLIACLITLTKWRLSL